ncbi:MAG: S8 family peptidase [Cryomorphaceae bacterium]
MRKYLLFLFFIPLALHAQKRDMLNFSLRAAIANAAPSDEIPVYLRGDLEFISGFVRENGGRMKGTLNGMAAVALPVAAFAKIANTPGIDYVEYSSGKGEVLGDQMIINNNVGPVHQGLSLPEAYRGKDVVIGIIDTGIELDHPDFQKEDGTTRVLSLWDQKQAANDPQRIPEPYGYGQEYTAEDINAGISGHNDQSQFFGHGSTVTGVALGNANATGDFPGVAPEADIFVVSSDFNKPNWTMTVAEAVEWIFDRAAAIGKPAVINASLGSYLGSHDGLDAAALHIDSLLEAAPGRAMICAAGNSQAWNPYHLGYDIPLNDTAFTWFAFNPQALENGAVFVEAWADVDNFQNTRFTIGADVISPAYGFRGYAPWRSAAENLNTVMTDTIFFEGANVGIVQTWVGQRGDQYHIQAAVTQPFSSQFRYRFSTTGGGRFDVWSSSNIGTSNMVSTNLPTSATYPPMVNYRMPDKLMTIVNSWACSDKVITVGNYVNRTEFENAAGGITEYPDITAGDISVNSSSGPTRDFRQKPEIAATGDVTLSAGRLANLNSLLAIDPTKVSASEMHYVNGGTSMASPVVAGAAALFFERCASATHEDFRTALIETAVADEFTGALPGLNFGYGKLDVFGLMLSVNATLGVFGTPESACEGEEAIITAVGGFSDYQWNTGDTGPVITVTEGGTFTVEAIDEISCLQRSQPLNYVFAEAPETPVIFESEGILAADGSAAAWQWYLDDSSIQGANEQLFEPVESGAYTVEAIAANECSTFSEPFNFGVVSTNDTDDDGYLLFPNPSSGMVRLSAKKHVDSIRLTDLTGKTVFRETVNLAPGGQVELSLSGIHSGLYIVSLYSGADVHNMKLVLDN